jgi:hypothetical protein
MTHSPTRFTAPAPRPQLSPKSRKQTNQAAALTFAEVFLISNRACFLRRMTLKRSKSDRFFLRSCWSRFLLKVDSENCLSISWFFQQVRRAPVPAARGRRWMTIGVSETLFR